MKDNHYDPKKLNDRDYTIGVLCSEFVEQFGEKAQKIVSRICYERGLALGKSFVGKEGKSFENAIKAFMSATEKTKAPGKIVCLENGRAVVRGTVCPLGLNGRGRYICETMMAMDQGILEEASGEKIKYTVCKTIAAGGDYCEVAFETA